MDSIAGVIKRHGPHQVATNSTRTGRSDFNTVTLNLLSLISVIPQLTVNLGTATEEEEEEFEKLLF